MNAQPKRNNTTIKRRRRKKKSSYGKAQLIAALIIVAIAIYASANREKRVSAQHGIDTPASELMMVNVPDGTPSQIVNYLGYSLSFNPRLHIPNWVAWELTGEETKGKTPRFDKFAQDPNVAGCAETYDYLYSGYDRGHMAPAADMKWNQSAMIQSFYLTNICPQSRELNTGAWRTLEEKCRLWAQADSAIVIIAGPVLSPAPREFIGDNRVAVPRSFFKIILSPYANPARVIAFLMPNSKVAGGMQSAVTTVDHIEELTGYDFFSMLPDSIENKIEAESDYPLWSSIKPGKRKK